MWKVVSASAFLLVLPWASLAQGHDRDGDGVADLTDNCLLVANPGQTNSDYDRFGNACDGDLDQDGDTDGADRALVAGEVDARRPRPVADLDGDGQVDAGDLEWFAARLARRAAGPAGARAHDADGDSLLDFCTPDAGLDAPADRLVNGGLDGAPPHGWSTPDSHYLVVTQDQGRRAAGALQWLTWGGAGRGSQDDCGSSCVQPDPVPIEPGRGYAFSFFTCVADFPPTTLTLVFGEYDSAGSFLAARKPENTSMVMNSAPGVWEENIFYYRPGSDDVARVQPKLFRKSGPDSARGTIWADDFAFWELPQDRDRRGRAPVSAKRPFDGARTRVDALGNLSVLREGTWIDVIPFGIYVHHAQDFQVYVDVGFDVVMNERGFGAEAAPAIDASSPLVPDGMWFMFSAHRWADVRSGQLPLENALSNLRTKRSPARGVRLWDRLLAFNYDNEVFARCGKQDPLSGQCLASMWAAEREPLARILQVDREENGGIRGVPTYSLNGNVGVARAFSGPASALDDRGSVRADTVGSYGAAAIGDLERAQNQQAPTLIVQVQGHVGDRFPAIVMGGLALGAKMVGVWRDWPASAPGRLRSAPELDLCGAARFGVRPRRTFDAAPGELVEGATSGARAEILDEAKPFLGCAGGPGASYRVHARRGGFEPGEGLVSVESGTLDGAVVAAFRGDGLVDYEVPITERSWYAGMPALRREIDALAPILRASHWTDWQARIRASATGVGPVQFGDNGIVWGTRSHGGKLYLILANTFHALDPSREFDTQFVGRPLDVAIRLERLPRPALHARRFDRQALAFRNDERIAIENDGFRIALPAFGTLVLQLVLAPIPEERPLGGGG